MVEMTPNALTQRYTYIELVGAGAAGKTYKAYDKLTGEHVAIKALRGQVDFKTRELFDREVETLKSIDVKGVPKFIDIVESPERADEVYLVQEFVDGVSLSALLDDAKSKAELSNDETDRHAETSESPKSDSALLDDDKDKRVDVTIDEALVKRFIVEIAGILDALQTQYTPPIIHRDIKPSNILFDVKSDRFYLIDFGSVTNPQRKSLNSTIAGTQGYMAPEQLLGDATIQSDFYGLGATALHLATGVSPVDMQSDGFTLLYDKYIDPLKWNYLVKVLIKRLLAPSPTDRPQSAREILEYFQKPHYFKGSEKDEEYPFFATLIYDTLGKKCARWWMRKKRENPWVNFLLFVPVLLCIAFFYIANAVLSYAAYLYGYREINEERFFIQKWLDEKNGIHVSGGAIRTYDEFIGKTFCFLIFYVSLFCCTFSLSILSFLYLPISTVLSYLFAFILSFLVSFFVLKLCRLIYSFMLVIMNAAVGCNHLFQFRCTLNRYVKLPKLFLPKYLDDDNSDLDAQVEEVIKKANNIENGESQNGRADDSERGCELSKQHSEAKPKSDYRIVLLKATIVSVNEAGFLVYIGLVYTYGGLAYLHSIALEKPSFMQALDVLVSENSVVRFFHKTSPQEFVGKKIDVAIDRFKPSNARLLREQSDERMESFWGWIRDNSEIESKTMTTKV